MTGHLIDIRRSHVSLWRMPSMLTGCRCDTIGEALRNLMPITLLLVSFRMHAFLRWSIEITTKFVIRVHVADVSCDASMSSTAVTLLPWAHQIQILLKSLKTHDSWFSVHIGISPVMSFFTVWSEVLGITSATIVTIQGLLGRVLSLQRGVAWTSF